MGDLLKNSDPRIDLPSTPRTPSMSPSGLSSASHRRRELYANIIV